MYNIYLKQVNNYTFEGFITENQLSDEQLKTLGLVRTLKNDAKIEAIGEFEVEWDDDIPMPVITETIALLGPNISPNDSIRYTLDLDTLQCNYEQLEDEISKHESTDWYADRQAYYADMADFYNDR